MLSSGMYFIVYLWEPREMLCSLLATMTVAFWPLREGAVIHSMIRGEVHRARWPHLASPHVWQFVEPVPMHHPFQKITYGLHKKI